MDRSARIVFEEYKRFEAALPSLLGRQDLNGRWVLFRHGAVQEAFDSRASAYAAGIERFGGRGGHVVARVAPPRPRPLTAAATFE